MEHPMSHPLPLASNPEDVNVLREIGSLEELYRRYRGPVQHYLYQLCGSSDQAEERLLWPAEQASPTRRGFLRPQRGQRASQLLGRRKPVARPLCEQPVNERFEGLEVLRRQRGEWHRILVEDVRHGFRRGGARERESPRRHLVHDHAE